MNKTNVMRLLDQKKIPYEMIEIDHPEGLSGVELAMKGKEPVEDVYKTLVTIGASKAHYVFVVPVSKELDLKKAAKAVNEKNIVMIPQKELLGLTGYIHGGCSPIGMKKFFPTVIDSSAIDKDSIYFSGGKVGVQVKLDPKNINKIIKADFKEITID